MIDIISDLIAYPIIGFLSMLDHVVGLSGGDVPNETIDQIGQMNEGNMMARWRYKVNHALGGTRTFEDYNKQEDQQMKSCCCGCGCLFMLIAVLFGIFILVLMSL